jgi:hypothetical protein
MGERRNMMKVLFVRPRSYAPHRFISTRGYGIVVRKRADTDSVASGVRSAQHAQVVRPILRHVEVLPAL